MLSFVLMSCIYALPALGGADVGAAAGQSLLQPSSARPAALGEAYAAEGGRSDTLAYNPAGLGSLRAMEVSAMYHAGFAGDTFVNACVGAPFMGFGVCAGAAYYSAGNVERVYPTGRTGEVSAQRDLIVNAGTGYRFRRFNLDFGAGAKMLRTELLEEVSGNVVGYDCGARFEAPSLGLSFGAALQNLGGHLRLDSEETPIDNQPLPCLVRLGAAYRLEVVRAAPRLGSLKSASEPRLREPSAPRQLLVLADAVLRVEEGARQFAVGAEYGAGSGLALRIGFRTLSHGAAARLDAYTLGLGFDLRVFRLDYAVEMLPFTSLHRLGLTVTPGPPR